MTFEIIQKICDSFHIGKVDNFKVEYDKEFDIDYFIVQTDDEFFYIFFFSDLLLFEFKNKLILQKFNDLKFINANDKFSEPKHKFDKYFCIYKVNKSI